MTRERTIQLANFVAQTTYNDLPTEVIERAKWVLRDTIGVTLGGLREPEVAALAQHAVDAATGDVTVFGRAKQTTPQYAVLVHGTAGTTLEMDEGHAFARGHAAVHSVYPALALAEQFGANGKDTLTALVLGYEVAARVGVATRLRKGVHPFGTWGVLGAAAIAARFKGLDRQGIADVLEVAASYAITSSYGTALQGANVRNTYAGVVNKLGLMAAEMYALGFRGERGGITTTFRDILGESFDENALTDGLGERYEIMRGYFKPYSACRYSHAAVDAVLSLTNGDPIVLDDIKMIRVDTYNIAAGLADQSPTTPLAARFSVPYVVAATLALGHAGPSAFDLDTIHDERIRRLAKQVAVNEDKAFTAMTPAKRPARVTLHFNNGSVREATVMGSKGDPDQPMTPDELRDKFHDLADPVIGQANATTVWEQIATFDTLDDVRELMAHLRSNI